MKRILIIAILIKLISTNLYGQKTLTQQEIDSIINSIGNTKIMQWGEALGAIQAVEKYQIKEALPAIEDNYWEQNNFVQWVSLRVLQKLGSTKFRAIAHATIDSAEHTLERRRDNRLDAEQLRLRATYYLIKDGDFSTAQYIFTPNAREKALGYVEMVILVLKNAPAYREQCKAALTDIIKTDSSFNDPWFAVRALGDVLGTEVFPELVWTFKHHPNGSVRLTALDYLLELKYPGLDSLLKERLLTQADKVYNHVFLRLLIEKFGKPSDYHFVEDYYEQQADPHFEGVLIKSFLFRDFKPPRPDSLTSIEVMIDSLISIKHQCNGYNWLVGGDFIDELDNYLMEARFKLTSGDSIGCARNIKQFQQAIDAEYHDSLNATAANVTAEGWKFLYYNAQYILDRLHQSSN